MQSRLPEPLALSSTIRLSRAWARPASTQGEPRVPQRKAECERAPLPQTGRCEKGALRVARAHARTCFVAHKSRHAGIAIFPLVPVYMILFVTPSEVGLNLLLRPPCRCGCGPCQPSPWIQQRPGVRTVCSRIAAIPPMDDELRSGSTAEEG